MTALLEVKDLRVHLFTGRGVVRAVDGIDFSLEAGRSLGIVGESGCGKSMTALSLLRLIPQPPARIVSGQILFDGADVVTMNAAALRELRGNRIAMIYQDPMTTLNPVFNIGEQIAESVRLHRGAGRAAATARAIEMLRLVGIPDPVRVAGAYPHQLSGGMRQRAVIAMALACDPRLLIADEPTTALDVTIQAQILELLRRLQTELGMAVILITHDLGVIADLVDDVVDGGARRQEHAPVGWQFAAPAHPYTQGPLRLAIAARPAGASPAHNRGHRAVAIRLAVRLSVPASLCARDGRVPEGGTLFDASRWRHSCGMLVTAAATSSARCDGWCAAPLMIEPLLTVRELTKHFPITGGPMGISAAGTVRAVDGVSFSIDTGETLALVGESGCGKSTTGRMLLRLTEPTAGSIHFDGSDLMKLSARELRRARQHIQIVFQDPYASLSPRQRIEDIVAEPLDVHRLYSSRTERRERVIELLRLVGLDAIHLRRRPFEFSGGQRQRIAIARALAPEPRLVVADEPVSALDVSIQAQVVNLLQDLQEKLGVAYLFISHDLAVVRHIARRVAVMYLGRLVELSETEALFTAPYHPYSQALLSAAPAADPERRRNRIILSGDVPSPVNVPSGCHFHPRCPIAQPLCRTNAPTLREVTPGRLAACHFAAPDPIPA